VLELARGQELELARELVLVQAEPSCPLELGLELVALGQRVQAQVRAE
jgi:hypothetical protein